MKKSTIIELLDHMPEDVDVDKLVYVLMLRREIERGLADIEAGRFVMDEDLDDDIDQWPE